MDEEFIVKFTTTLVIALTAEISRCPDQTPLLYEDKSLPKSSFGELFDYSLNLNRNLFSGYQPFTRQLTEKL